MGLGGGDVPATGNPRHSLDGGENGEGEERVSWSTGLDEECERRVGSRPYTFYLILYIGEHRVGSRHISTAGEVQEGAGPCEDQQSKVEKQNKKFKH